MTGNPQSWFDLSVMSPQDPTSIIAYATLPDSTAMPVTGVFKRSTNFKLPSGVWTTAPVVLTGTPTCQSNDPTTALTIQEALQWNLSHQVRTTDPLIPSPLAQMLFLKNGPTFGMTIPFNFSATVTDIEISFLENFATAGDYTGGSSGTIPVISFTSVNNFGGSNRNLVLTLRRTGTFMVVMRLIDNAANRSVFYMPWVIVP